MLLSLVYFAMRCLLQALAPSRREDLEREAEFLVLRHQLKVLSRGARRPPLRRRDRILARRSQPYPAPPSVAGVRRDPSNSAPVAPGARSPQVDVSAPWTGQAESRSGTVDLILRIRGELLKLGVRVSATAVRTVLRRHGLGPALAGAVPRGASS